MKNQIRNKKIKLSNLKDKTTFPNDVHQIILGSLLGDMHCKRECVNSNIEETHSITQKDYLIWKYSSLNKHIDLILSYYNNPICKAKGKIYTRKPSIKLRSKVSKKLNKYHHLFYQDNKKIINKELLNELDELGLAVWYCDDGHYDLENKTVQIHTEGFSLKENQVLKEWFHKRWNLTINFKKDYSKTKVALRFPVKDSEKFLNMVKAHLFDMPPTIWYKLGHLHEGNNKLINKAKLNKKRRYKEYQGRTEVKIKRNQQTKERYYKNREEIFRKIVEYRKTQKYKEYIKKYNQKPEVIKKRRERERLHRQDPKFKMKRAIYQKEYRKRQEVKNRIKEYNRKAREKQKKGDSN